ncbi:MAG: T9SS type A sorting domain-containing protein [Saprospiraceae bacterium]
MNRLSLLLMWHKKVSLLFIAITLSLAVKAGIVFDGSPGTGAPPPTLGGLTMIPVPVDNRPLFANESFISVSNSCPAQINFGASMNHRRIGNGWATWSHGYTGDVYYNNGVTTTVITLPACSRGVYFYVEPDPFGFFDVSASANDGTTSGNISVDGFGGAHYVGFYTTSSSCLLTTITITSTVEFAIGEFATNVNYDVNNGALACNDNVQISLGVDCQATISPEMILEGEKTPICPCDYVVVARDWNTNKVIDVDPNTPGTQIGVDQIGTTLKITVTDPFTGNSCWGKAYIEDKLPPTLTCPDNVTIECFEDISPRSTGEPTVYEGCGIYTLTYKDVVTKGSCNLGYDKVITRTFTAVDETGNKSTCVQFITVSLGNLNNLYYPLNYDGLVLPGHTYALKCDEKIDKNKDITPHLLDAPTCVDGYLLDSAYWLSTSLRVPKKLGWNCLDYGQYIGHPNPHAIYYPAKPGCWGDNEFVMWEGTGEPGNAGCSNIAVTFRDIRIDISKPGCDAGPVGCYKVLRVWTLLNWCTGEVKDTNQIIKVMDNVPPKILYPDSLVVSTDPWRCEGRWDVAPAWLADNCSNEIHYTIRVEDGTVLGNDKSGYVVVNLPLGIQNAYIVAEDCCGNVTERRIVLDVQDNTPPNAVCDQKTVVTISGTQSPGDNTAKVFAETFDDGSFDNCSAHLSFKVIRMDELLGTNNGSTKDNTATCNGVNGDDDLRELGNQVYFDDYVKFCCADVGKSIMVVFRVYDVSTGAGPVHPNAMNQGGYLFGHFSDCMVEVEVQDKSIPTVVAPPDIVISCNFWFDVNTLGNPNDATFGKVVNDLAWRSKVKTSDIVCPYFCQKNLITGYPGGIAGRPASLQTAADKACDAYTTLFNPAHPDNKYDIIWGFDGYVLSSCNVTPLINVRDLRVCGQGRILRDVTAKGPNGVIITATQTIWVVNCDPFYVNRGNNCDPNDDIIWPDCQGLGTTIDGCGADISPDNPKLGRPEIVNGARNHCNLIAIEPFDEIFTIEPDACYKILRKWIVIDWCQYDPNIDPEKGRWEFTQIIKVRDQVKPIVTCNVGNCEPAVYSTSLQSCVGHINLTVTATDSCTPNDWLLVEYKLDAFNNGTFDYNVGKLTLKEYNQGIKPTLHNNQFADNPNNPFDASGVYPIGVHRICWYVEDGCGNIGQCCTLFEVKDCKAPTPYCLTGIITVPMPTTGCIDIWAKDLDFNSSDNCTPRNKLKFYFDGDTAKRSIRVCCDDFVRQQKSDELSISVQVWVEDEEGNKDYCVTTVIVQDNQNICPNPPTANTGNVNGLIRTENGDLTAKAGVELYNKNLLTRETTTNNSGSYLFGDLSLNTEYQLKSKRNDEAANGVSTADIVKIQRHILGIEELASPYKLIAADVNKSNSITASDISEIRKLILGINAEFTKVPSWAIIPSDYVFVTPKQPWDYSSEKTFVTLSQSSKVDFIAVKMGDVNNTANASNANGNASTRSGSSLNLFVDEKQLVAGESYTMDIKAMDFNNVNGFQFTLNFDPAVLSFDGFESKAVAVDASNFGTVKSENGLLTMSWDAKQAMTLDESQILFSLKFNVLSNSDNSKLFAITSDITAAEAYNNKLDTKSVKLSVRSGKSIVESSMFELYQNAPNPFDKITEISFRMAEDATANLSIYDVTGKVIYIKQLNAQKGLNTIKVERADLNGAGMYYYQLDSGNHTATKRMVIIE